MSNRGKSKERAGGGAAAGAPSSVGLKSPPGIEVDGSEQNGDPVPGKITEKEWLASKVNRAVVTLPTKYIGLKSEGMA